jgi:ribosomal protein L37AE/L43A
MNTNHYSDMYENEFNYKCQSCGSTESISNTEKYGWICDSCISEYERIDTQEDYNHI